MNTHTPIDVLFRDIVRECNGITTLKYVTEEIIKAVNERKENKEIEMFKVNVDMDNYMETGIKEYYISLAWYYEREDTYIKDRVMVCGTMFKEGDGIIG